MQKQIVFIQMLRSETTNAKSDVDFRLKLFKCENEAHFLLLTYVKKP